MTAAPVMMGEMAAAGSRRLRAVRSLNLENFSGLMDAVPQVGPDEGRVEKPHPDQDCERALEEQPSAEDHALRRTATLPIPHFLISMALVSTLPAASLETSALTESGADTPPRGGVAQEHGPLPRDPRDRSTWSSTEARPSLQADDGKPSHRHHPAARLSNAPAADPAAAAGLPQAPPPLTTLRGTAAAVKVTEQEMQDLDTQPCVAGEGLPEGVAVSLVEPATPVYSPAQQVARVLSTACAAPDALPPALAQESSLRPPVQVLKLSLQPRELGQLRLTLRFSGDALDLKVEAETPEALRSLERDRAVIGKILLDAGVPAPLTRIEFRMGQFEPAAPSAIGADPDTARRFSGSSGGDPHDPPQRPGIAERRTSDDQIQPDVSVRPGRNGLYL